MTETRYPITVAKKYGVWHIDAIGTEFISWMQQRHSEHLGVSWWVNYYSGSMTKISIRCDRLAAEVYMKWA
jgi:hypothetical protein